MAKWMVVVAVAASAMAAALVLSPLADSKTATGMTLLSRTEMEQWWGGHSVNCGPRRCDTWKCLGDPERCTVPNCQKKIPGTRCTTKLVGTPHPGKACSNIITQGEPDCYEAEDICIALYDCFCRTSGSGGLVCMQESGSIEPVKEHFCLPDA